MPVGGADAGLTRTIRAAPTALLLIATNAIPLAGVAFAGWNLGTVMVLYWAENGIIGLATIARILLVTVRPLPERPVAPAEILGNLGTALFFSVHYGIFWVVHGVFVFALFGGGLPSVTEGVDPPVAVEGNGIDPAAVATGLFGLALYHAVSFLYWDVYRGGARRSGVQAIVFSPYPRLVVLHLTIILGAFIVAATGRPIAALAFLVVLKTILDLAGHLFDRGLFRPSAALAAPPPAQ